MNIPTERVKELFIRGFAIIGFIAILLFGLWGTVKVITLAPQIFSSIASVSTSLSALFVPNQKITVNTPTSLVPSDSVFELSWSHTGKPEQTQYSLSYTCKEGLTLHIQNEGGVYQEIPCDTEFSFASEKNAVTFIPVSEKSHFTDTVITLRAYDVRGTEVAKDESLITITNERLSGELLNENTQLKNEGTKTQGTTAGAETNTIYPINDSRSVSSAQGVVDLTVEILAIGSVDTNNVFTPKDSIKTSDRGAVRFEIENLGTKTSNQWAFNAVLPTLPLHIFHSTMQQGLNPGDKIQFTLGFTQVRQEVGDAVITINVDPTGSIQEPNKANNIKQFTVKIVK